MAINYHLCKLNGKFFSRSPRSKNYPIFVYLTHFFLNEEIFNLICTGMYSISIGYFTHNFVNVFSNFSSIQSVSVFGP